jgi:hypothetical protein
MVDRPVVDSSSPHAVPPDVSMDQADWIVVTATGSGFRPDPANVGMWDACRYRCRGTTGPGEGPSTDGGWPVGNVSDNQFQFLAPTAPDPCVVDFQLHARLEMEWTDWVDNVLVVGDPPRTSGARMETYAARAGEQVLITGPNLANVVEVQVGIGDILERLRVGPPEVSAGVVVFDMPELPMGPRPTVVVVAVRYPAGLTTAESWIPAAPAMLYLPVGPPGVDEYGPTEGTVEGGTTVTIRGYNLDKTLAVRVGTAAAQLLFVDYFQVIIATPPAPGGATGEVDIVLQLEEDPEEPDTREALAEFVVGPFTYTPRVIAPPPTITGFLPTSGPSTGGTVLTISGANLDQVTEVRVGNIAATDLDATFGRVVCRTPPRAVAGATIVEAFYLGEPGRVIAPGLFDYTIIAPPAEEEPCRRQAWLTLPGRELPLEDFEAGYVCVELDIGWPIVREVVTNSPDQDGVDDRTSLFGGRVVTAHIIAGGMRGSRTPDDIARAFGPFLTPRVRPVLHWTVDSPETEYAERTLTLRVSEFTAPIEGAFRDLHLAWVAPDPVVRAAVPREAQTRPAYTGASGRRYDLTFDRAYPAGPTGAVVGQIISPGDVEVLPLVRIFGPITGPSFTVASYPPDVAPLTSAFVFQSSFRIDGGRFVDVDCRAHTAIADDGTRVEARINWASTTWPVALGGGILNTIALNGTSTDHISQAVALWRDGFLGL